MGRQAWWRDGFPHPTGSRGAWLSPGHAAAAMVSVHPFAAPQAPRALTQPALGWYLPRRLPANLLRPVPAPPACPSSPAGRGGGGGGSCGLGTALEGARAGYEPGCGAGRTEQEGSAVLTTSCVSDPAFMLGKLRRSGRGGLVEKQWQSLGERSSTGTRLGHPVLTRSKTCDPSFCTDAEQAGVATGRQGNSSPSVSLEARGSGGFPQPHGPGRTVSAGQVPREDPSWFRGRGGDGAGGCGVPVPQAPCHASPTPRPPPQLSKRTASYRKAFGELTEREELLACFSCAWQREVPYHGRLYITSYHVCFHSSLLLKDIKAVVPVASISSLKKTNTALLVPNALSIRTAEGQKFLFVSLRRREAAYQLLKSVCKHLQDNSWSPLASLSNEEILRKPLTSSQSDLEQSTPEPDNLQEPLDGLTPTPRQAEEEDEEVAALALSSSERVPLAKPRSFWGGLHTTLWARITAQLSLLNTVLLIYLLLMMTLLLSSMYIGLRIMELEQQLASVEARPDLNLSQQYKT
ncbi:uncharacterized protein LOC142035408 isoform X1 [Buteo buteo]|uniref:uncharacterized protein LOC142035408 isoform X1 n=1 Tax=Buteo buteo TaxID=30397 RepID=UPI003EBB2B90